MIFHLQLFSVYRPVCILLKIFKSPRFPRQIPQLYHRIPNFWPSNRAGVRKDAPNSETRIFLELIDSPSKTEWTKLNEGF